MSSCYLVYSQPKQTPLLIKKTTGAEWSSESRAASPLDVMALVNASGKRVEVSDGEGVVYFRSTIRTEIDFTVSGALGKHQVWQIGNSNAKTLLFEFNVDAVTSINDDGYYKKMFELFRKGMNQDKDEGISWNGKYYRYFEPWVLDHCENMRGMKYFKSYSTEFIDLMRATQRSDGMIYSFIQTPLNTDYFFTRDKVSGYTQKIGDRVFTRQPTENHPEYQYVNAIYQCWQAEGDTAWMKKNVLSAERALDYTLHDSARWSKRFGLLKRVYTIDSWDFAVEDKYMPDLGITNSMMVDAQKSKFGIFFGDNTGYATACYELADMLGHAGRTSDAKIFVARGDTIRNRLDRLAWNGKYFTHFIEEDSTVKRNLGVDEKSQIAQSNAYSLNRDISPAQRKAIIETYLDLKTRLPAGSPGEWYAIYPPFQKGFTKHDAVWQYMNGGVGGHVAGELARGAYENGYEKYGTDILDRLYELGKKYDGKLYFAYTGSLTPPPPAPVYTPLDISAYANMDNQVSKNTESLSWMNSKREGDDFRDLPLGLQNWNGIPFNIPEREKNKNRTVVAVSRLNGFPVSIDIPVHQQAGAIYLLHTSSKPASENVAGAITFSYEDGSAKTEYIINGKQLVYWWFSRLETEYSGIAWYGKNKVSEGIGLSWCAINNPDPDKKIAKLTVVSPEGNSIYTVFAITLADRKREPPVNPVSFGGPDNWAASLAMAALIEGLAGVKNQTGTVAFSQPLISPRWVTTESDTAFVTVRYAASRAYVAYRFIRDTSKKQIRMQVTGNGRNLNCHVLLPENSADVKKVKMNNMVLPYTNSVVDKSRYVDFTVANTEPGEIIIEYR